MVRGLAAVIAILVAFTPVACKPADRPGDDPAPPPPAGRLPSSMAALGDSLSGGYGACFFPAPCERNSWSTGDGTQIVSHYERIAEANPRLEGRAYNFAVTRARAADLDPQAREAVKRKAQYVTVQIGANDACRPDIADMTTVAAFRAQVDEALTVLRDGLPKARVLVVSIPDIYRVWQLGHTNKVAVRAWSRNVCPALLADPTSLADADADRRRAFRDRITAYNRELRAACDAYGTRCLWDGGAAHRVRFTLKDLAAFDFFHPNVAGQQKLADVTFPDSFTW
jgi:lysophospholipase L1-like esterase